jgi:hypothetical protein
MRRSAVRRNRAPAQAQAGRHRQSFAPASTPGATLSQAPWETAAPGYSQPGYQQPGYQQPGYGYPGHRDYPGAPVHPTAPPPGSAGQWQPAAPQRPAGGRDVTVIAAAEESDARIARLSYVDGTLIGATQILALLAGISRSGVTIAGGLWRGLDHEDAARFAFLLATPVILAAGVLKVPSLFGPAGAHIHG